MILYHGTNKKFNEFKPSIKGSFGRGIYLSPNYATAKMYGKYLYKVKTNLKNPLYINSNTDEILLKHVKNNEIEELQKLGYDGLIIGNENYISEVVVWDNTQLEIVNESLKEDLNDNFWKWFGKSKVVDKQGKPLEVYHGTKVDNIEVFKLNNTDKYPAIYFTDSYEVAITYAWAKPMKCYLRIEKPLIVDGERKGYYDGARDIIVDSLEKAIKGNYDGVIINNLDDDAIQDGEGEIATTYIVFSPKQIKSVDNKGIWSDSDNIYEHLNEEEYLYAHIPLEDCEVYKENIEILVYSIGENTKIVRDFMKDYAEVRCLIYKDKIYLWDAYAATHQPVAEYLEKEVGFKYTFGNSFMFNKTEIDGSSLQYIVEDYDNTPDQREYAEEYLRNYELLKNLFGVDFSEYWQKELQKLKNIINNIFESLKREIERYL